MSDIHSTITTTAGCLFYQLVSFAFEVSLRKSVQISLIAVSGSAHKDRLDIVQRTSGLLWKRGLGHPSYHHQW